MKSISAVTLTGVLALLAALGCEKPNTYAPPPPPKVTVATPQTQQVQEYYTTVAQTRAMNRVELRAFQKTGKQIQDPTAKPGTMTEEIANIFPPEFNTNSVLETDVKPGTNVDVDFKIRLE